MHRGALHSPERLFFLTIELLEVLQWKFGTVIKVALGTSCLLKSNLSEASTHTQMTRFNTWYGLQTNYWTF